MDGREVARSDRVSNALCRNAEPACQLGSGEKPIEFNRIHVRMIGRGCQSSQTPQHGANVAGCVRVQLRGAMTLDQRRARLRRAPLRSAAMWERSCPCHSRHRRTSSQLVRPSGCPLWFRWRSRIHSPTRKHARSRAGSASRLRAGAAQGDASSAARRDCSEVSRSVLRIRATDRSSGASARPILGMEGAASIASAATVASSASERCEPSNGRSMNNNTRFWIWSKKSANDWSD